MRTTRHAERDDLAFYVAGGLSAERREALRRHLRDCASCKSELQLWHGVSRAVEADAAARPGELPPLSLVVREHLRPRPSRAEAAGASLAMTWAQRRVVLRGLGAVGAAVFILLALAATLALQEGPKSLPLFFVLPMVAAIFAAFVGPRSDAAYDLVATTVTPPAFLVFARLTVVLGFLTAFAAPGSLLVGLLGGFDPLSLTAAWLAPMLLLSALATVLAILWRPMAAVGVTLGLWTSVVLLVASELGGRALVSASLLPLLEPDLLLLAGYCSLAGCLWILAFRLAGRERPHPSLEATS